MIQLQYEQQKHVQEQQANDSNLQIPDIQPSSSLAEEAPPPPSLPENEDEDDPTSPPRNLPTTSPAISYSALLNSSDNFVGLGTLILKSPEEMLRRGDCRESDSTSFTGGEDAPLVSERDEPTSAFGGMNRSGGALNSLVTYGTLSSFRDAKEQLSDDDLQRLHNDPDSHRTPPPPSPTHFCAGDYHLQRHDTYCSNNGAFVDQLTRKISGIDDDTDESIEACPSLLRCILAPISRSLQIIWNTESLHRAFCYGAIDGMLTGAGIVSAFCGFDLINTDAPNSPQIRALVVAFTAAACFADSVCIAVGHIWTAHVMATAQVAERAEARQELQEHKAEAKGRLVDMLLSKGMLTLDAKSLADTLEGYPDMFVSVLTGESLWGATSATVPSQTGTGAASEDQHQENLLYEVSTKDVQNVSVAFRSSWRGVLSYGRLTDFEMDPDNLSIRNASVEARRESVSMMLGFSLLSVVPSLIFTWVPAMLVDGEHSAGSLIQPNTLVIFLTACVMWCLGVWKSHFMDSNWLMFGFETVMVLFLCIGCAYGLGTVLNALFLPDDYVLEVAKPIEKALSVKSSDGSLRGNPFG